MPDVNIVWLVYLYYEKIWCPALVNVLSPVSTELTMNTLIHNTQPWISNLRGVSKNKLSFKMDSSFCASCMSRYLTELSNMIAKLKNRREKC